MPRPQVVALVLLVACKGKETRSVDPSRVAGDADIVEVPGGIVDASVSVVVESPPDAGTTEGGIGLPATDRGAIGKARRDTKGAITVAVARDAGVPVPDAAVSAAPPNPNPLSEATKQRAKDPRNHLQPEQGTLSVGAANARAGTAATATVEVKAASGWHVSQEYPTKLWVEPAAGVMIEKTFYTAGGKHGRGDATTLTEQALAFSVKATPQAAGTYAVTGVLTFGICERDSCHPKTQAITIQVAAN